MLFRTALIALLLPSAALANPATRAQDLADFDFVTRTVEENYAGWDSKTVGARRARLDNLTTTLRARISTGDASAFPAAVIEWIGWFDDGHLQLIWNEAPPPAPEPAQPALATPRPPTGFALTRLDADTLYLRLPSFGAEHTETVRALVAAHQQALASTPHLVIDVRDNGGGSDFVYDPVLPYLYTGPIRRMGVEVRVSPLNARLRREAADQIAEASPEGARVLRSESDRMATATGRFIRREPAETVVRLDGPRPYPRRVAILIDRAASSAESFLLDARQSSKVVLMGQDNSAGVLDFAEMMATPAPSGRFTLAWATTRSLRLPADPVDPDGIAPTVRIPADVTDPVAQAAAHLAAMARNSPPN